MRSREAASSFLPIQLGICCVEVDPSRQKAAIHPFNIYMVPYFEDLLGANFVSSQSAMHFLASNDLDFNKLFYEGVNYLSLESEKRLTTMNLTKKARQEIMNSRQSDLAEFKMLLQTYEAEIENFVKKASDQPEVTWETHVSIDYVRPSVYKTFEEHLKNKYTGLFFTFTYDSDHLPKRKKLIIKAHNAEEAQQIKLEEKSKALSNAEEVELGGLRKIIQLLSDLEKPLVLHNGFMDALYLYKAFVGQLPLRQEDFKQRFKYFFPHVYDTKILSKLGGFHKQSLTQSTNLEKTYQDALAFRDKAPVAHIDSQLYRYSINDVNNKEGHHEAGFDAMATGYAFLKLSDFDNMISDKTNKFLNKLHLNGMTQTFDLNEKQSSLPMKRIFKCSIHSRSMKVLFAHKVVDALKTIEEKIGKILKHDVLPVLSNHEFLFMLNDEKTENELFVSLSGDIDAVISTVILLS